MHEWLVQLRNSLALGAEAGAAARLALNLVIGGALALYVRELFKRFSSTVSNRDSFANVFPLLTITTILVIFIVRSSLALSLGLVGALSIVRFRAAIKEPEELVFLFFCIAIGLALGADHPLLAFVATLVATAFCVLRWQMGRRPRQQNLLLTVTADTRQAGRDGRLAETVSAIAGGCVIQRLDVDDSQVQVRAVVRPEQPAEVAAMVDSLHAALPDCRISYVNLESLV